MKTDNASFTGTGNPLTMVWERHPGDTVRQVRDLVQR